MVWHPDGTKTPNVFHTTPCHMRPRSMCWRSLKTMRRPMQFCCQEGFLDINVMTSSCYHQAPQKRHVTCVPSVLNYGLTCTLTLKAVWLEYNMACQESNRQPAAYTTFTALWRQLIPTIMVMKPMSDLCWVCQKNSTAIMRAANKPDTAKSDVRHTQIEL